MQLWRFYLARALRPDQRWTVEVLPDGHRDWQDDWRQAKPVEVMDSRAEAFGKAIETALKIQTDR
jgi:hypothetical protein